MEEKVVTILNEMSEYLSIPQMKKLQEVMVNTFAENQADTKKIENKEFLQMFLDAKKIEGSPYSPVRRQPAYKRRQR